MNLSEAELSRMSETLEQLQLEHKDLDHVIVLLSDVHVLDQLRIKRMKKRKLLLKDQISQIKSILIPDLNA